MRIYFLALKRMKIAWTKHYQATQVFASCHVAIFQPHSHTVNLGWFFLLENTCSENCDNPRDLFQDAIWSEAILWMHAHWSAFKFAASCMGEIASSLSGPKPCKSSLNLFWVQCSEGRNSSPPQVWVSPLRIKTNFPGSNERPVTVFVWWSHCFCKRSDGGVGIANPHRTRCFASLSSS